jgi:hypothetical protein
LLHFTGRRSNKEDRGRAEELDFKAMKNGEMRNDIEDRREADLVAFRAIWWIDEKLGLNNVARAFSQGGCCRIIEMQG